MKCSCGLPHVVLLNGVTVVVTTKNVEAGEDLVPGPVYLAGDRKLYQSRPE